MPLSPQDVAALSRLADVAAALPGAEVETWLQLLPAEQQPLVPHLRGMLAAWQSGDTGADPAIAPALPALPALPQDAGQAQAGDMIGPYRLVALIGQGGMGRVWQAARADGLYERDVALKLPDLVRSPALAERMARERQIGARLEHPHIARLYDAGIDAAGRPFLVMEWVRGHNLVEHATRSHLTRAQRLALLLQACAGVAHAHAHLIVHRDIKPSNILVDEAGQVKLLDFGIARWLAQDDADVSHSSLGDEARGTHTPGYAAPEQRAGGAVSTATDIYALGAVAHELLLGTLPEQPSTLSAAAARDLGPDLAAVLACALRPAPEQRYSSVDRLADDLRRVLDGRATEVASASWARRLHLFARRHRRPLAATLAGVAVVAAAGAVALQERMRERQQAERLAQAREFLMDVLEDAEPLEGQGDAPITAQQMVDGALQRARDGFEGQDVLRGTVLSHLGFMMRRLQQPERALDVLREAQEVLQASAEPDDPSLHIASTQLALQMLGADRPERAEAERMARAALVGCQADNVRCARARLYANDVLRSVAMQQGDVRSASAHAEAAVRESERAFGAGHAEAAMTRLHWAQVLRNAGDLPGAQRALAQAEAVASRTMLRVADRLQMSLWAVIVAADLGAHEDAVLRTRALLARPESRDEHALLQRLLAQSLYAQGHFAAARDSAQVSIAAAVQAGDEWNEAFARQALARVLPLLGDHGPAWDGIERVQASLQAQGLGEGSVERLRARRLAGEIALRAGDDARARAFLQGLPVLHRREAGAPPLAPVDLAQALDLLGVLERRAGRMEAAAALHAEAGALLQAALPEVHPLRLRHELDAALATGRGVEAPLRRYLDALPPDSGWRALLEPLAADTSAAARGLW